MIFCVYYLTSVAKKLAIESVYYSRRNRVTRVSCGIRRDRSHRRDSDGRRPPVVPSAGSAAVDPLEAFFVHRLERVYLRLFVFHRPSPGMSGALFYALLWFESFSSSLQPPASCREWQQQLSKHHTTRVAPTGLARRYPQWRRYSSKGPTCAPDERWPSPNGEFVSRAHPSPRVAGQTAVHRTSPILLAGPTARTAYARCCVEL